MNVSTIIQTIIGIVFIYLLLALLASEIQENIAGLSEMRAKRLKRSIQEFFQETDTAHPLTDKFYNHPSIKALNQKGWRISHILLTPICSLLNKCINSPQKSNSRDRDSIGPSYISPELFAEVASEIIPGNSTVSQPQISPGATNASTNMDEEKQKKLKEQFEAIQERSSGVYKRNSKVLSLFIAFVISFIANADLFKMIDNLSKDNHNYTTQLINRLEEKSQDLFTKDIDSNQRFTPAQREIISNLVEDNVTLPLGWDYNVDADNRDKTVEILKKNKDICTSKKPEDLTKCSEELYSSVKSNKNILIYLGDEFISNLKSLDEKPDTQSKFPEIYTASLTRLKTEQKKSITNLPSIDFINKTIDKQGGWLKVLPGWLISTIAIAMGAPFWFDLLGRIMNVRNAGGSFTRRRR